MRLEELKKGARVLGLSAAGPVTVVSVDWMGEGTVKVAWEDDEGKLDGNLIFRKHEPELSLDGDGSPWPLDADPDLFLLASEAKRIRMAYLLDPFLAAEISDVDPYPHQIEAVYSEMLPRQPLRFLLADDPGAGKTIMAGLFIKELMVRGDLERCLVVAPGGLVEQWQDELGEKFGVELQQLTRADIEASRKGDPFSERPLMVARLDMLSRDEELVEQLAETEWDLVVVDEAHKMSASYVGHELKTTKRYRLGQRLGEVSRHLLLMTATPHNGHPEDFDLFMALLDPDRFAGKRRGGEKDGQTPDTARDLMRRVVKEELLRFDGTKLFPKRVAYTAKYTLSDEEMALYDRVSDYVREGMNRADKLEHGGRKNVVGFALTTLQRRLASSPEAILRSVERRRERLSKRLVEVRTPASGEEWDLDLAVPSAETGLQLDDFEEFDADELLDSEVEKVEDEVVDAASSARTIAELEAEIAELVQLEAQARDLHRQGTDKKWDELAKLLGNTPEMLDQNGRLQKLIVFTEHRDTLLYLVRKLRRLLGDDDAVVAIHGGVHRQQRRAVQERFTSDENVVVLVATDAAGEGLNLQRAHLMVNYDLPWNPNRIEQRFGRIHRIRQTEICRLWNMVADGTREGQVFETLLDKLKEQSEALGGKVFDVLGEAFSDKSLRELLVEAIRSHDPERRRAKAKEVIDANVGEKMNALIKAQSLLVDILSPTDVVGLRDQMQRAQAHKLQPSYVRRFFLQGFDHLGGRAVRRERGRLQVNRVPALLKKHGIQHGHGRVMDRYERICFERQHIDEPGKPMAVMVAPGHPLLDATVGMILDRHSHLLQQGTVLVDPNDLGTEPRVLVYLEHEIVDASKDRRGQRRVVSKRFEFVAIDESGNVGDAGYHPYVDYRRPKPEEEAELAAIRSQGWIRTSLLDVAQQYAIEHNAAKHLAEVEGRVHAHVDATAAAVKQRLKAEYDYWDAQSLKLKDQELAGKRNAKLNSARARQRADEAEDRLKRRLAELALERKLSALPPRVTGGSVVVPVGWLKERLGEPIPPAFATETEHTDWLAVQAVLATEQALGRHPVEMPHNNKGYDIETRSSPHDELLFVEVKGRRAGADVFTITASELLCGLNNGLNHILALVEVAEDDSTDVRYLYDPFTVASEGEPSPLEVSKQVKWQKYRDLAGPPT